MKDFPSAQPCNWLPSLSLQIWYLSNCEPATHEEYIGSQNILPPYCVLLYINLYIPTHSPHNHTQSEQDYNFVNPAIQNNNVSYHNCCAIKATSSSSNKPRRGLKQGPISFWFCTSRNCHTRPLSALTYRHLPACAFISKTSLLPQLSCCRCKREWWKQRSVPLTKTSTTALLQFAAFPTFQPLAMTRLSIRNQKKKLPPHFPKEYWGALAHNVSKRKSPNEPNIKKALFLRNDPLSPL